MKRNNRLLALIGLGILVIGSAFATFAGGDGTLNNPYQVETADHLDNVRNYLDAHFIQIGDIDLGLYPWNSEEGWLPIGDSGNPFTGYYNGGGYLIKNLYIMRPANNNIGLFGSISESKIESVYLINVDIHGYWSVGALAGMMDSSTITKCYSTGYVEGYNSVGGLIGWVTGTHLAHSYVESVFSVCQVKGSNILGGLIGFLEMEYSISNSFARGPVSGGTNAGGFIGRSEEGYNLNGNVLNSYSTGAVTGSSNVGGFFGVNQSSTVTNSYWDTETSGQASSSAGDGRTTADMTHPHSLGTYVSWDFQNIWIPDDNYDENDGYPYLIWYENPEIEFFANGDGSVSEPYEIASAEHLYNIRHFTGYFRLVADINMGTAPWNTGSGWLPIGREDRPFTGVFYNSSHTILGLTIDLSGTNHVGLFGYIEDAELTGISLINVDVTGYQSVGGLVGKIDTGLVSDCFVSGTVSGHTQTGGLAGTNEQGIVSGCQAVIDVTGSSSYTGGLIGRNYWDASILNSFSSGFVSGNEHTGGLVGSNVASSTVQGCYSSAIVSSSGESAGGLVGLNSSSAITECYAAGDVNGDYFVGGLVGTNQYSSSDIEYCYSIGRVTGQFLTGGLIGRGIDYAYPPIHSYWDMETSDQSSSPGGGTGLTTYEMLWEDSFTNWSFNENPWAMKNPNSYVREVYPHLHWQEGPGDHNHAEAMVKLYDLGYRVYWESFPRLEEQGDYNYTVDLLEQLAGDIHRVECNNAVQDEAAMNWNYDENEWGGPQEVSFFSRFGYQLHFRGNFHELFVRGTRIPPNTWIQMQVGSNWIGYFLPESQHFLDAIGQAQLNGLTHVYSENWSAWNDNGDWIYQPYPAPVMEYAKMYNLVAGSAWSGNFRWIQPNSSESESERYFSQFFEFEDLPEYEAIFIYDIADDEDVLEVGVYAGDECVGASVFHQSYPLEIQAYTNQSHANEILSFVIHRGERSEPRRFDTVQIRNSGTGKYRTGFLRAQQRPMSVIKLGAAGEYSEAVTKPEIILSQNFPNPFVPGSGSRSGMTEIPFYISQRSEVSLSVYNIRGQKVKELLTGTVEEGKHTLFWNGMNEVNREVSSGVYFYRLETGDKVLTRKLLLVR